VPDLIRRRAVYVHKGKAFVPMANQLSLVLDEFGSQLSKMLQVSAEYLMEYILKTDLRSFFVIIITIRQQQKHYQGWKKTID
jgi:DNA primase large subunit